MDCIICGGQTRYYFSKTYAGERYDFVMKDIGPVDFWRCVDCGFTISKTMQDLSPAQWEKVNADWHHRDESKETVSSTNQAPYAEQALMLAVLGRNGFIDLTSMLDYAAGYGHLAGILGKYFGIELPIFERYVTQGARTYVAEDQLSRYKTVINSAMFEHVTRREHLEEVNGLVTDDGALVLHTVVCENIPADPDWFYIIPPVHTALHTNKSMQVLMNQWGYKSSIYSPQSKCWVLFKQESNDMAERVEALNWEMQTQWFFYKPGFVDYWKGF